MNPLAVGGRKVNVGYWSAFLPSCCRKQIAEVLTILAPVGWFRVDRDDLCLANFAYWPCAYWGSNKVRNLESLGTLESWQASSFQTCLLEFWYLERLLVPSKR